MSFARDAVIWRVLGQYLLSGEGIRDGVPVRLLSEHCWSTRSFAAALSSG